MHHWKYKPEGLKCRANQKKKNPDRLRKEGNVTSLVHNILNSTLSIYLLRSLFLTIFILSRHLPTVTFMSYPKLKASSSVYLWVFASRCLYLYKHNHVFSTLSACFTDRDGAGCQSFSMCLKWGQKARDWVSNQTFTASLGFTWQSLPQHLSFEVIPLTFFPL